VVIVVAPLLPSEEGQIREEGLGSELYIYEYVKQAHSFFGAKTRVPYRAPPICAKLRRQGSWGTWGSVHRFASCCLPRPEESEELSPRHTYRYAAITYAMRKRPYRS